MTGYSCVFLLEMTFFLTSLPSRSGNTRMYSPQCVFVFVERVLLLLFAGSG